MKISQHNHGSARFSDSGAIAWMARNPVAANLLMFTAFLLGVVGLLSVKQEVFPEFDLDVVNVTVVYPGASPAEVEQGIVLAIEEAVRGLDGVKRVTSVAAEGAGNVSVELLLGADANEVLTDVKTAVDRIVSFPEEAEKPTVAIASRRRQVISLVLAGEFSLHELHAWAERARADLLDLPEITQVELEGVRPLEVAVEISRETLEAYGLSLDDVAKVIGASSVELPSGAIETDTGDVLLRVADRRLRGSEFADVIVKKTAAGFPVRLRDIAHIVDGYADTKQASYFNGQRAVRVTAYRVGDETPIEVAAAVRRYADELRREVPEKLTVAIWDDNSELLAARIDLLVRNARVGFVLVFVVLTLFLDLRLASWVSLGIPVSFFGAFALMPALDVSINMVSLFALIVTLGMVVDDAIVVGENVYAKREAGMSPLQAAISGTQEMAVPVVFAVLTTFAAFAPLLFVPGVMGKIFRLIPLVVFAVLGLSLVESFFVLPSHLSHVPKGVRASWLVPLYRFFQGLHHRQQHLARHLGSVLETRFPPLLQVALRWRHVTVALAIACLIITFAGLKAGLVPFSFFPRLEGDLVVASARLPYGVPIERTVEVQRALEAGVRAAVADHGGDGIVRGLFTHVGEGMRTRGPRGGAAAVGSHLVTVELELTSSDTREVTARQIEESWRAHTDVPAGVEVLSFKSTTGPSAGSAIDVQLSHLDTRVLAQASADLARSLHGFASLNNIENGYAAGKPQRDLKLLPAARTYGLTSADVARQLRASFLGAEALREQRGRNEIKVMVRLPKEQRVSEYDLDTLLIRTPGGTSVPLGSVASLQRGRAPTAIMREEGRRVVNVTAELAAGVASSRHVREPLVGETLPALQRRYKGIDAQLVGEQREQSESFASLGQGYLVGLFVIFALLAIPFKSYVQPLIIMTVIPFGIVGAVLGHVLMGYGLSIISIFGIVALSGVVVNDSLVLIDATNQARRNGLSAWDAVVYGATRRLRPILLTSVTTFFGLMPMIVERSLQARFLIPMAISLGFGVLFSTLIVLILVPCLYLFVEARRERRAALPFAQAADEAAAAVSTGAV